MSTRNRTDPFSRPTSAASRERRRKFYAAHKFRCTKCGKFTSFTKSGDEQPNRYLTIHHVIPYAHGGPNLQWNLVPLCNHCNNATGHDFVPELWRSGIPQEFYEWAERMKRVG